MRARGRLQLNPEISEPAGGSSSCSDFSAPRWASLTTSCSRSLSSSRRLAGSLATAAAIVVFTAAVRLLLSPLSVLAYRGQASIASAAACRRRAPAQVRAPAGPAPAGARGACTRAEGGGMLAGCLPLLLQLPFFSVMYRLFLSKTVAGHPNALLRQRSAHDAARQSLADRRRPRQRARPGVPRVVRGAGGDRFPGRASCQVTGREHRRGCHGGGRDSRGGHSARHGSAAGAATQPGLAALGRILPYSTVVVAAFVPLAAVLYLVTTTGWTAAERAVLRCWHQAGA